LPKAAREYLSKKTGKTMKTSTCVYEKNLCASGENEALKTKSVRGCLRKKARK